MKKLVLKIVALSVDRPKTVLLLIAVITSLFAVQFPKINIDTDPENMLEDNQPDRVFYNEIKKDFRINDLLVVGITDPQGIFRPEALERVNSIISEILQIDGIVVQDVTSLTTSYNPVSEGPGHVNIDIVMPKVPLTLQAGQQLFEEISDNWCIENRIISSDGKSTAIYIPVKEKDMSQDIAFAIEEILDRQLLPGQSSYFAGLPIAEDTFGFEMFKQMAMVAPLAFLFIMIIVYFMFRQSIFLIPLGIDAMFAVIWAMGLLIGTGHTVHIMSSMIPVFLMPIAILDDCHVLSEFFDRFRATGDRHRALNETYHELYRPMIQTTLTSAAGFASLALTDIPPVRVFGIFVAFGIIAAWLFSMTVVPAILSLMNEEKLRKAVSARAGKSSSSLDSILQWFGQVSFAKGRFVLIITIIAVAIGITGVTRIEVNDNPVNWFKKSHLLRKADNFMNEYFGGTYMAYLVATGNEPEKFLQPEVLRYINRLQKHIEKEEVVGMTTSAADPVLRFNQALHDFDESYIRIPDSKEAVAQILFLIEIGGDPNDLAMFLNQERSKSLIWVQMKKGDNKYMHTVENRAFEFMENNPPPDGVSFRWSGLAYINKVWQELMVIGMLKAILGASLVVLILMLLEFRSWILGLLSMVPMTLAILFTYGLAGWTGKDYDMPIAVCSTLTLGMAIDFAIHYIQRWKTQYALHQDIKKAHSYMFEEPGRAILRNAIVITLGFLPLVLSTLMPYVTVGLTFALIMLISTLATLLILPAVLRYAGPRLLKGGK